MNGAPKLGHRANETPRSAKPQAYPARHACALASCNQRDADGGQHSGGAVLEKV